MSGSSNHQRRRHAFSNSVGINCRSTALDNTNEYFCVILYILCSTKSFRQNTFSMQRVSYVCLWCSRFFDQRYTHGGCHASEFEFCKNQYRKTFHKTPKRTNYFNEAQIFRFSASTINKINCSLACRLIAM